MSSRRIKPAGSSVIGTEDLLRLVPVLSRAAGVREKVRVSVAYLPNSEMCALKRRLLGKRMKFVNVLSFPHPAGFPAPEGRGRYLGEIYLNAFYRRRRQESCRMFIHGFLHLLGFRHEANRDTIVMERLETRLLARIAE